MVVGGGRDHSAGPPLLPRKPPDLPPWSGRVTPVGPPGRCAIPFSNPLAISALLVPMTKRGME